MKQLFLPVFLALALPLVGQELKPGLIGVYYQMAKPGPDQPPAGAKPFLVRVDPHIRFSDAGGDFGGSKLSDRFLVHWKGHLQVPVGGTYTFTLRSDDGSKLLIDGEVVLDHWGMHSPSNKSSTVELAAGVYPVEVRFTEGGGGALCELSWKIPGKEVAIVPASAFAHDPRALAALDWDEGAWKKVKAPSRKSGSPAGGGKYNFAYGPFLGTALRAGRYDGMDNDIFRGIVIPLDESGERCVAFDADTCRMSAGWVEGGLVLQGLPFSGGHGAFPEARGDLLFAIRPGPGCAGPNGSFEDPRTSEAANLAPLGNLPKHWAHYQGLYVNGPHVILSYTLGKARVLEMPGGGEGLVMRRFDVETKGQDVHIVLATDTAARIQLAGPGTLSERDGRHVLTLPGTRPRIQTAVVFTPPDSELAFEPGDGIDLRRLCQGGDARWPDTITTQGVPATDQESQNKPYVIDRLTLPKAPSGLRFRVGGFDFFEDGARAAVCTWDGDVWIVEGIDQDLDELVWKRFASGMHEPLGLKIVDGVIYTVSDDQITRYHDLNHDGEADYYENFNSDWDLTSGFHAFCFDLHNDPAGNFLFAFGSPVRGGGRSFERMGRHHGCILRVSADGSKLDVYASGLRAPNGMGVGPQGQVTTGDNEGTFVPRCPINWVKEGDFLGVVDSYVNRHELKTTATRPERTGNKPKHLDVSEAPRPLAWLPKGVDNSGGGQVWVTSDRWGPFGGELLHLSYGRSAMYLVLRDSHKQGMQGGVVKFPLRFTSSAMRGRFNPRDGQLYVAGLRGWQTNAAKEGGFDRVRYTGAPVAMPNRLKTSKGRMELGFTAPLDEELATDLESFQLKAANITWTHSYGSAEFHVPWAGRKRGEKGWSEVAIEKVELIDDHTIRLTIPGLQPAHMFQLDYDLETAEGDELINSLHTTVHYLE